MPFEMPALAKSSCDLQAEIRALRDENFVLGQKLEVEHEQATKLRVATARISSDMELGSERYMRCVFGTFVWHGSAKV
jgi:hypothetical protein